MENAFANVMEEMSAIQPREFHPELEYTQPGELDFLKDAYEVGKDGKVSCFSSPWIFCLTVVLACVHFEVMLLRVFVATRVTVPPVLLSRLF